MTDSQPNPTSIPPPKRPRTLEEDEDEITSLRNEVEALKATVDLLLKEVASLKGSSTPPTPPIPPPQPSPRRSYREAVSSASASASAPHRSSTPSPPSEDWTEVRSKTKKSSKTTTKTSSPKTSPSPSRGQAPAPSSKETPRSLKDSLGGLTSAEKLKVLLRSPRPEEDRTTLVDIVTATLPLSRKAQAQPMVAWKQALQELTGQQPLLISLINPCRAEIYLDTKVSTQVKDSLSQLGYLEDPIDLTDRDLVRRKRAYLSGYFLLLRRAAFQGLTDTQQLQLLQLAEEDLSPAKWPDPSTRKQWIFQIKKDRQWIEEVMEE